MAPVEPIVLPELVSFEAEDGEQELFGEPWLPLAEEDEPSQTPLEDPPRKPGTKPAPRPVPKPAAVAIARTSAVPTDSPKPAYPKDARRHEAEGTAYIRASVSTSGTVTATALSKSSGHASLDEAARKAVARWKFRPATRGGQATATTVIVPVQFALR